MCICVYVFVFPKYTREWFCFVLRQNLSLVREFPDWLDSKSQANFSGLLQFWDYRHIFPYLTFVCISEERKAACQVMCIVKYNWPTIFQKTYIRSRCSQDVTTNLHLYRCVIFIRGNTKIQIYYKLSIRVITTKLTSRSLGIILFILKISWLFLFRCMCVCLQQFTHAGVSAIYRASDLLELEL